MLHAPLGDRPSASNARATVQPLAAPVPRARNVAIVGNFPPRRCGIATFTADVADSLGEKVTPRVIAMSDGPTDYAAPVSDVIRQDEREDYVRTALALNASKVDVVSLQHEFGIFGGDAGDYILDFLEHLQRPVVTTLHTILESPNDDQRRVLCAVIRRSSRIIVMSEMGVDILRRRYNAPAQHILVVPHGAPDRPFVASDEMKGALGFEGRQVLMTFGLLSPNKGIEHVIAGLPEIVATHPDTLYVVLGATHPHLLRREGDAYLQSLKTLAADLGVSEHVRFEHRFLSQEELLDYLQAADIYVTPYRHEAQITSGTLAYAVALGKPVISTPYWHAREILADGVGRLTPFDDTVAMTAAIKDVLSDDVARRRMAERAYAKGRSAIWARSGESYREAFDAALRESSRIVARAPTPPAPRLEAVSRMTDDCGILQHGCGVIADRTHGYCLDDAVRGLILVNRLNALGLHPPALRRLNDVYCAFIQHAWSDDAQGFRNFMGYDRRWLEPIGSPDSIGRTFWALGETIQSPLTPAIGAWANRLLTRSAPAVRHLASLRSGAFALLGVAQLPAALWPTNLRPALLEFGERLHTALREARKPGWIWFERELTYDNARLVEALLIYAEAIGCAQTQRDALSALRWLTDVQTSPEGFFQPAGNASFNDRHASPALFDQQPLEAAAMADAAARAFRVTGDRRWRREAQRAHDWFHGANSQRMRVVDDEGGCHDGVTVDGLNLNQGAESILAAQMAACTVAALRALA
jgi:glycosyltransferase involved in cell wall biosynthesis